VKSGQRESKKWKCKSRNGKAGSVKEESKREKAKE
jgi:hypothetical protein